jgi:hypothetical protein
MALYHLVENPVRRSAYFDRPRHFLVAYAAGFAVVVLLAISALASKGWRHRFSADVLRLADATDDRDEQANDCEYQKGEWPGPSGPCCIGKLDVQPTWAVLGDSHAWALSKAFSLFLEQRKERGVLVFSHGCMPVSGLLGNRCMTFLCPHHRRTASHGELIAETIVVFSRLAPGPWAVAIDEVDAFTDGGVAGAEDFIERAGTGHG